MTYITNKTFDEININDTANLTHTLTQRDIELFAIMSGDVNPAHVDPEYAKNDMFHQIVAHGMWGGALISTLLGTQLPGPGTIYLNQTLNFLHPIVLGDTVVVTVRVTKKYILSEANRKGKLIEKRIIELDCACVNQANQMVISGQAKVLAPTEKISRERVILPEIMLK